MLLGLDHCRFVCGPGEVSRDESALIFKSVHSLHTVDLQRSVLSLLLLEASDDFFVFVVFSSRSFDEHQVVSSRICLISS